MKRRQFIRYSTATALGALIVAPIGTNNALQADLDLLLASPDLLHFLGDEQYIHAIGKKYRVMYVDEDDEGILSTLLIEALDHPNFATKEVLRQQISTDFATGQVVHINGWVLSLTEARQCALYSFLYS